MSALPLQIDTSRAAAGAAMVASPHHQVTRLLVHAMLLVERDQQGAMDYMRRASALAGQADNLSEQLDASARGGLAPWQKERVKRYIDKEYAGRIQIYQLAQMTRLSTSYFSAAFRVSFGTSPHDYICQHRVEKAKHLMLSSDTPLCDIALDCGFADQPHLSRVFRRVTGTTPGQWRRMRLGE